MTSTPQKEFTFKVHGLSTGHPLRVRIFCAEPLIQDHLMLTMLRNAFTYMTSKLGLPRESIYIRTADRDEHHYFKMKDLEFEWTEIRAFAHHPFVIIYSEIDLRYHEKAQLFIKRNSISHNSLQDVSQLQKTNSGNRSASVITTQVERRDMVKNTVLLIENDGSSQESTKSIEKKKEYLTRNIATSPRPGPKRDPHVYAETPQKSPFSFLKEGEPDTVLLSPIYLSPDDIIVRYNNNQKRNVSDNLWTNYQQNAQGELVLCNKAVLDAEKGILKEVIGNRLSSMFSKDANQGLPIRIFKPFSQLETIASLFCNFDFLHKAAQVADPLTQFKLVMAYAFGSWAYGINPWKPFTPYMGETLQAKTADGTEIYLEHHGHKPFVDSMYICNKASNFSISATFEADSDESANVIIVKFKGLVTVTVKNRRFCYTLPSIVNEGFSYNKRTLSLRENCCFYSPELKMKALIRFGALPRPNEVDGGIYPVEYVIPPNAKHFEKTLFRSGKPDARESILAKISGCWYEKLCFDSVPIWESSAPSYKLLMKKDVLPSDWRFREDILWLLYENPKLALSWKLKLEEAQREFRMRRAKFLQKNKQYQYK